MKSYPVGKKGPELIAYPLLLSSFMYNWIAETWVKHEHIVFLYKHTVVSVNVCHI